MKKIIVCLLEMFLILVGCNSSLDYNKLIKNIEKEDAEAIPLSSSEIYIVQRISDDEETEMRLKYIVKSGSEISLLDDSDILISFKSIIERNTLECDSIIGIRFTYKNNSIKVSNVGIISDVWFDNDMRTGFLVNDKTFKTTFSEDILTIEALEDVILARKLGISYDMSNSLKKGSIIKIKLLF